MPRNDLVYNAPNGLEVTPYRGTIGDVTADAAVTREDKVFAEESYVTQALQTKYPQLRVKREGLQRQNKIFRFFRNQLWTVKVSELSNFIVFHAIMKQPGEEGSDGDWGKNMSRMYRELLVKAEKLNVKVLAIPLLGSGNNARTAAKVLIDVLLSHTRRHLVKVYIVSIGKKDILAAILYCREKMVLTRGNQPEGSMTAKKDNGHLPGYNGHGTIEITYSFNDGKQGDEHPNPGEPYKGIRRNVYLPDTSDGRMVLGLLKTAFDRMITFTIGTSETTHEKNVIKFTGIPLKTRRDGGKEKYGYPDPSYLKTVQDYLSDHGITKGTRIHIRYPSGRAPMQRHPTAPAKSVEGENSAPVRRGNTVPAPKASAVKNPAPIERQQVVNREAQDLSRGNCMFVALSRQLKLVLHKDMGHSELRAKLVQYFRDNPNQPGSMTPYSDFLTEDKSWEVYLQKMSRDGEWGDNLMLQAAAELFTVRIVVNEGQPDQLRIKPSGSRWTQELSLLYSDGCHYDSVG